jgi:hypothetical protein
VGGCGKKKSGCRGLKQPSFRRFDGVVVGLWLEGAKGRRMMMAGGSRQCVNDSVESLWSFHAAAAPSRLLVAAPVLSNRKENSHM